VSSWAAEIRQANVRGRRTCVAFLSTVAAVIWKTPQTSLCSIPWNERWYYTCTVASRTHVLYIGVTGNIERRLSQHKEKAFEGFTADYNCNSLVYYELYKSPSRAIAREKQLKVWSRSKKLALIKNMNPAWVDLSGEWGQPIKLLTPAFRP
jgi:putative endonuclease